MTFLVVISSWETCGNDTAGFKLRAEQKQPLSVTARRAFCIAWPGAGRKRQRDTSSILLRTSLPSMAFIVGNSILAQRAWAVQAAYG